MHSLLTTLLLPLSLVPFSPDPTNTVVTGTYGICGMAGEVPIIQLDIAPDHSFHFLDASNTAKPVDVHGTWDFQGSTFVLRTSDGEIFEIWNMDKDQPCLRARKGLSFKRLCQLEGSN